MLRTNFNNNDLTFYEKAIKEFQEKTKSDRLLITPIAFGGNDIIVDDYSALHDYESGDLSEFWKIYDRIKAENTIIKQCTNGKEIQKP